MVNFHMTAIKDNFLLMLIPSSTTLSAVQEITVACPAKVEMLYKLLVMVGGFTCGFCDYMKCL